MRLCRRVSPPMVFPDANGLGRQGKEYGGGVAWGAELNPCTNHFGHHCMRTYTMRTRCSICNGLLRKIATMCPHMTPRCVEGGVFGVEARRVLAGHSGASYTWCVCFSWDCTPHIVLCVVMLGHTYMIIINRWRCLCWQLILWALSSGQ